MTNDDNNIEIDLTRVNAGKLYIPESLLPPEERGDQEKLIDELREAIEDGLRPDQPTDHQTAYYIHAPSHWKGEEGGTEIALPTPETVSFVGTSEDEKSTAEAGFEVTEVKDCTGELFCEGTEHTDRCFSKDRTVTACDRLGCDHSEDKRVLKYDPTSPDSKEQDELQGVARYIMELALWEGRERRHKSIDPAHPWLVREESFRLLGALRGAGFTFVRETPKEENS